MNEDDTRTRLEPRVASLETELRQVVKIISDLSSSFERVENKIQSIALLVERVGAPKQANWFAIIATAVSVTALFITLGGLVLYPMTKEITHFHAWSEQHGNLELHPVGKTRIDALEKSIDASTKAVAAASTKNFDDLKTMVEKLSDKTENILNRITVLETIAKPLKP